MFKHRTRYVPNTSDHSSATRCEVLEPRVLLAADPMTFSNVGIGGGSYIIGAEVHPLDSNLLYASTDIGGLYRKDGNNDLKPLLDWVPYEKQSLYGVSGFDIKPNDTNVIVATLGKYDEAWNPGHADQGVYVSFDKGENWAKSGPTLHQDANNQVGGRGGAMGSRIAFDPSNPRYMIAGSSGHGTYVVDTFNNYNAADDSYTYISSLAEGTRTQAIDFDPSNANNIYIAIRDVGIYRTSGGVFGSFSLIPGSPTDINDMEVNGDGTKLLVATDSAVRRLDNPTFNNSFTTINLPDFNNDGNNAALTINRDPNTTDRFYTARPQTGGIYTIARTEDAGTNWSYLQLPGAPSEPYDQQYAWHLDFWPGAVIADIEVDPNDSDRVIFTDWFSMWETTDVFAPQVTFSNEIAANHEEVVGLNLAPAFGGNADNIRLFSGLTDVGTVRHADLNVPVQTTSLATGLPEINDTTGVVTTAADPNRVYVAGIDKQTNSTATVGVSFDAGETYTDYNSYDGTNWGWARIAASNGDANRIVAVTRFGGVRWSANSGQTWNAASGLPSNSNELGFNNNVDIYSYRDMIAADGGNNNTFYVYRNTNGGQIYRSDDGGANWFVASSNVPATNAVNYDLRGVPGQAGHLWLAIKGQALRYSTDGGYNWNVASEIQDAFLVAGGKEKPGFTDKTIYTFGRKAGDDGYYLYGSTDVGASW
ncbi:MAG: LEPR-XLL domain-containing protein, partial [Planctomycetota bacterium]